MLIDEAKTMTVLNDFSINFRKVNGAKMSPEDWNTLILEISNPWEKFIDENKQDWGVDTVEEGTYITLEKAKELYRVEILDAWQRERKENMFFVELGLFERYQQMLENIRDFEIDQVFKVEAKEISYDEVGSFLLRMNREAEDFLRVAVEHGYVRSADKIVGEEKRYMTVSEYYRRVEGLKLEILKELDDRVRKIEEQIKLEGGDPDKDVEDLVAFEVGVEGGLATESGKIPEHVF